MFKNYYLVFIILIGCIGCASYDYSRVATAISKDPNVLAVKFFEDSVEEQLAQKYQLIYLLNYDLLMANNGERYLSNSPMIYLLKDERLVTSDASKKYTKVFLLEKNLAIMDRKGINSYEKGSVEWCQRIEVTLFANGSGLIPCSLEWSSKVMRALKAKSY